MNQKLASAKVIILFLLLLILPFLALSLFNFPVADDYSYAEAKMSMGFWTSQLQMYFGWSGRYVSTALLSLSPLAFGTMDGYIFLGAFNVLLLGFSFFVFSKVIVGKLLSKSELALFFIGFYAVYMSEMPSPVEGFYWLSGFVTYTWAFSIFLMILSLFCWYQGWGFEQKPNKISKFQKASFLVLMCFCSILIGGLNETLNVTWIYILIVGLIYEYKTKKEISRLLSYTLLFAIIALAISVLAPGNKVREAQLATEHNILKTIFKSLGLSVEIFFRYLKVPYLLALLISIPKILSLKPKIEPWFYQKQTRWMTFFLYAALSFLFLGPAEWAMSHSPPRRTLNMLCAMHLFSFGIMYCQYLWSHPNRNSGFLRFCDTLQTKYLRGFGSIVFLLSLLIIGNIGVAWYDLLFKARTFDRENKERIAIFQQNQMKDVVLKPYSDPPITLFFDDIIEDRADWRNASLAYYFGAKSVRLESSSQGSYHRAEIH